MISLEETIRHLAALGLAGNTDGVRRYVRRVIRHLSSRPELASLKSELSAIVADVPGGSSPFRGAHPRDPVSFQTLLQAREFSAADVPVLEPKTREALEQIVREHREGERLRSSGIEPTRSVLLIGQPGVGKTMSAGYLASQLDLPMYVLDLSAVVSSLLGRTGQNLKSVLDHARSSPCVLFLDEFDALAKRRDDPSDVGELKRIVNVLLVELEQWPTHGLLIAATNHPELLDRAVERRFGRIVEIPLPGDLVRQQIITATFANVGLNVREEVVRMASAALDGTPPSTIVRHSTDAIRRVILGQEPDASFALFREVSALSQEDGRRVERAEALRLLTRKAIKSMNLSYREAAERLGVSHMTVARSVRAASRTHTKTGKRQF